MVITNKLHPNQRISDHCVSPDEWENYDLNFRYQSYENPFKYDTENDHPFTFSPGQNCSDFPFNNQPAPSRSLAERKQHPSNFQFGHDDIGARFRIQYE